MKKQMQRKMVFAADESKKQQIISTLIESKKPLHIMEAVHKILAIATIGGAALYIFLNLVLNSWNIAYVNGQPVKDYLNIFLTGGIILVIGGLLTWGTKFMLDRFVSKDLTSRYDEQLELNTGALRYTYRDKHLNSNVDRVIATIALDQVSSHYDPKLRKMEFKGAIDFAFHEVTKDGKQVNHESKESIVLYDYWDPSVHYILQKSGVEFLEE